MIGYLSGRVASVREQALILDVQGVGYLVHAGQGLLAKLAEGDMLELHVETIIREDAFMLYGFVSPDIQNLFNILHGVQGVGPKLALGILDHLPPRALREAVAQGAAGTFKPVPGVGPKLAARLVTELKDKILPVDGDDLVGGDVVASGQGFAFQKDLISALGNLGFQDSRVKTKIRELFQSMPDASFEEVLRVALRELGHG